MAALSWLKAYWIQTETWSDNLQQTGEQLMKPVVILGVFVADLAFRTPRMPVMGETVIGPLFKLGPGGKGSNQAVAAKRAGAEVSFRIRCFSINKPILELIAICWFFSGPKPPRVHWPVAPLGAIKYHLNA